MIKITPELSKQVGLDARHVSWPTKEQVLNSNEYQRLLWWRFLGAVRTEEQLEIMGMLADWKD